MPGAADIIACSANWDMKQAKCTIYFSCVFCLHILQPFKAAGGAQIWAAFNVALSTAALIQFVLYVRRERSKGRRGHEFAAVAVESSATATVTAIKSQTEAI